MWDMIILALLGVIAIFVVVFVFAFAIVYGAVWFKKATAEKKSFKCPFCPESLQVSSIDFWEKYGNHLKDKHPKEYEIHLEINKKMSIMETIDHAVRSLVIPMANVEVRIDYPPSLMLFDSYTGMGFSFPAGTPTVRTSEDWRLPTQEAIRLIKNLHATYPLLVEDYLSKMVNNFRAKQDIYCAEKTNQMLESIIGTVKPIDVRDSLVVLVEHFDYLMGKHDKQTYENQLRGLLKVLNSLYV